jgi:hypothetical protein
MLLASHPVANVGISQVLVPGNLRPPPVRPRGDAGHMLIEEEGFTLLSPADAGCPLAPRARREKRTEYDGSDAFACDAETAPQA